MDSIPTTSISSADYCRALRLVDDISSLGSLIRVQQQECGAQAERITFLENKVTTLEENLGVSKAEASHSAEKLEFSEELLKEVQDVNLRLQAELEDYRQRAQRAEATSIELQNQVEEQKRRSESQIAALQHQIEELQPQTSRRSETMPTVFDREEMPESKPVIKCEVKSEDDLIDLTDLPEAQSPREEQIKIMGPSVKVSHSWADLRAYPFTRAMLKSFFGGAEMSTIVTPSTSSKTQLAIEYGVDTFVCPKRSMNPWLPRAPGEHGFMFHGLGHDKSTFEGEAAVVCSLFVGIQPSRVALQYYGRYHMERTTELTLEEWSGLREEDRIEYVKLTADKVKELGRSMTAIRRMYDVGELRVPCVALKCVDFDNALFNVMLDRSNATAGIRKRSSSPKPFMKSKRSRHSEA